MKHILLFIFLMFLSSCHVQEITVKVYPEKMNSINPRLFGHFLERPSWGDEFGIEDAVLDETGQLDPRVLQKLKGLNIPVLRFPGGTDVDYLDWTDMIDLPGRSERPLSKSRPQTDTVSNRFGYDEYYELSKELNCETIIPLNFFDAYLKRKPLKEAAMHMAGLVAYCNAEVGQKLPQGMKDWPSIRAKNGYKEPHKFQYFQIGNETWALWNWKKEILEEMSFEDPYGWYVECLKEYIRLIKEIDPDVKIIVDYVNEDLFKQMYDKLNDQVEYYVFHAYMPWNINDSNTERNGEKVPVSSLEREEAWNAFVSIPNTFDALGRSVEKHNLIDFAREMNFKIAVTEWNWNGWWGEENYPFRSHWAQGLGAAGFLQAFLRASDVIDIANQSMLVGSSWDITGIRVFKDGKPPVYYPTGQVTSFYAEHHGPFILKSEQRGIPTFRQPLRLNNIRPAEKVAILDIVATGSDNTVNIFCVNRDFSNDHQIEIDLSPFPGNIQNGRHIIMTGVLDDSEIVDIFKTGYTQLETKILQTGSTSVSINVPVRSLSVIKLEIE